MKHRPTSPRIQRLRQEVAKEKRRRKSRDDEPKSSRYLIAVAGVALLVAIVALQSPFSSPPSAPSVAEGAMP